MKNKKLVTHNGSFHSDEIFAIATLLIWAEKEGINLEIKRSRDSNLIEKADFVVDVGGIYDPQKGKFDHHQGGIRARENGAPYASFGLVWKEYGKIICGGEDIQRIIDEKLALPIDSLDNGIAVSLPNNLGIYDYRFSGAVNAFNSTWEESPDNDDSFFEVLGFVKKLLTREIILERALIKGNKIVERIIQSQSNPEILILENYVDWEEVVSKHKEIMFVIYPNRGSEGWCLQSPRDNLEEYSNRILFPLNWAGKRDDELSKISGVLDAIFCHYGRFFAVAKSKEGAIEMATKTLKNSEKIN